MKFNHFILTNSGGFLDFHKIIRQGIYEIILNSNIKMTFRYLKLDEKSKTLNSKSVPNFRSSASTVQELSIFQFEIFHLQILKLKSPKSKQFFILKIMKPFNTRTNFHKPPLNLDKIEKNYLYMKISFLHVLDKPMPSTTIC